MKTTGSRDLQAVSLEVTKMKRLIAVTLLLSVGAVTVAVVGQRLPWFVSQQSFTAREFTVYDGVSADPRVRLSAHGLSLIDKDGSLRLGMTLGEDGAPTLTFFDASRRLRAVISLGSVGSPGLTLHDSTGKVRALMKVSPEDVPAVVIYDANGGAMTKLP